MGNIPVEPLPTTELKTIEDTTNENCIGAYYDPTRFKSAFRVDMTVSAEEKDRLSREALEFLEQSPRHTTFAIPELRCMVEKTDKFYDVKLHHFTKHIYNIFHRQVFSGFVFMNERNKRSTFYITNKEYQQMYVIYMYCGEPSLVEPFHGCQMKQKTIRVENNQGKNFREYEMANSVCSSDTSMYEASN